MDDIFQPETVDRRARAQIALRFYLIGHSKTVSFSCARIKPFGQTGRQTGITHLPRSGVDVVGDAVHGYLALG